jgi:hypothetical protein
MAGKLWELRNNGGKIVRTQKKMFAKLWGLRKNVRTSLHCEDRQKCQIERYWINYWKVRLELKIWEAKLMNFKNVNQIR